MACGLHAAARNVAFIAIHTFWSSLPAINTIHVIKTHMHKAGVKTSCQIAETVQLLGVWHPDPYFGGLCPPSRPPNILPPDFAGDLHPPVYQTLSADI